MIEYGVIVYSPAPADPMALDPEHVKQLESYPSQAKELGGKVLGGSYFGGLRGFAFQSSTAAMAVRGDAVRAGALVDSDLVPAAFFVLKAPDMDVAVRIALLHPAAREGGVEVRPMFVAPKE